MAWAASVLEAFSRTLLLILNIIMVICGLGLIGVQSWVINHYRDQETKGDGLNYLVAFLVITLFIEAVAVLGIVAGVKERTPNILTSYIVSMILILLCALILSIIFLVQANGDEAEGTTFRDSFINGVKNYNQKTTTKLFIDYFQKTYECCGSNNYLDWNQQGKTIPNSCCKVNDCVVKEPENLYAQGCAQLYQQFIAKFFRIQGYYGLAVVVAQLICIVCAIAIAIRERRIVKGHFLLLQPINDQNLPDYLQSANYEVQNL